MRVAWTPPATSAASIRAPRPGAAPDASARTSTPCRDAGAFDGSPRRRAGASRWSTRSAARRCRSAIEVVGFSEEEGVRFGVPFIGSRALAGTLDADLLGLATRRHAPWTRRSAPSDWTRAQLAEAASDRVLSAISSSTSSRGRCSNASICRSPWSTAIAGQSRAGRDLSRAGQPRRHDADAAAPRCAGGAAARGSPWSKATPATRAGLVATVGRIEVAPARNNVVPGEVRASLDVRHADDAVRHASVAALLAAAQGIGERRGVSVDWRQHADQSATRLRRVPDRLAVARRDSRGIAGPPDAERRRARRDDSRHAHAGGDVVPALARRTQPPSRRDGKRGRRRSGARRGRRAPGRPGAHACMTW